MIIYPVEIKLLSETTFGSGESQNGRVNEEILLDNEGLPYFLGKTFKGCLRKSIDDILKPYYLANKQGEKFLNIIKKLFGMGDSGEDTETKEQKKNTQSQKYGKLKFSNFYLHDDILKIFPKTNKAEILDVLTDIRFSIKIDESLGVAKDGSLRATRVLKKGLVFVGSIECEEELKEDEFEILKQGISSLKNLGVNKSRGKGQVKISIGEKIEVNNNKNKIGENCNYLFYEINLREPVKIGDSSSKYDYEESKLYITGASIRGAIINQYLTKKSLNSDILKNIYFSNSYPIYFDGGKRYSFPTPNIFVISKDTDKSDTSQYTKEKFSNLLDVFESEQFKEKDTEKEEERRVIKLKKGSFSYYVKENKTLYQFDVKKDFRFHHTKDKETENIFRYESISKNQQFYGVIDISKLDMDSKKKFINVLEYISIFYLGGSRTGGYGKTEIINIEGIKDFKELKKKLNYLNCEENTKGTNDIYLLSDVMLRDKNHQIISNFSEEYLKEKLEDDTIKILNSQINPTIIKGFNSTWKSHIPQSYAMEKGSVIRIKGNLHTTKIHKFIKMYHGDKVQDGLGKVIINPVFLDVNNIEYKNYQGDVYEDEYKIQYTSVDNETIARITKLRDEKDIDKKIKEYISKNIYEESVDGLSLSQINNVIYEIDKCIMDEKNKGQYLDKLKEISTNKNKTENNRNILNIKIDDNVSFRDVLNNDITKYKSDLLEKVFYKNTSIIKKIDKNKSLLKILRWKLYYMIKIIKLNKDKKEGGKHE